MAFNDSRRKEDYKEIGKQFAYEGLDESYLKDATEEQIEEFRKGYKEISDKLSHQVSNRSDDLILNNDSRSMHR